MNSEEIKSAMENEINQMDFVPPLGISIHNVNELLVEPIIIKLLDITGAVKDYWLVLDELPQDLSNGYRVVFDENENCFGIATKTTMKTKEYGYLCGLYGSFSDALKNM